MEPGFSSSRGREGDCSCTCHSVCLEVPPIGAEEFVSISFLRHEDGFAKCAVELSKLVPDTPITVLLIADSDYGAKIEEWGKVAWRNEFAQSIDFVFAKNGAFAGSRFCLFLTNKQLPVCLQACVDKGLS